MPKSQKHLRCLSPHLAKLCQHCRKTIFMAMCGDPMYTPFVWDASCSIVQRMLFGWD